MDPVTITAALAGLIAIGTALGLLHRRLTGRVARSADRGGGTIDPGAIDPGAIDPGALLPGAVLGEQATVVQFSSEVCTRCPAVRRMLGELVRQRPGVAYLDVDLTHRADLAVRLRVRQTPTLFLLDSAGTLRSRIGGAPTRAALTTELDRLLETR
ncbi:thioredoxin [Rathayibacter tritici]|uniref:TlpA family protein disulfide reductase n=1 Tax=Rathayibacter tritici TaxID=33888 RepID=UPI000CE858C0|nr:thioredoxin family protein [Rathayibacter tritici]PPF28894.1 thioredoxin [Rathayibacter tritici]PPF66814.1 thioredoxin [Rathayibacter tritici]PPG06917.1 thioredoxin [Rathayibacter tritici]PPI12478.1 thioredoxin [Rathayibacter tritici]